MYLADLTRRRGLRAQISARNLFCTAVAGAAASAACQTIGRRCRSAWLYRQGQRSGAFRACRQGASAGIENHRTMARMEHRVARRSHRLCAVAQYSRRADQEKYLKPESEYMAFEP